ncbi:GAP family protein [Lentzea sp. NPDC055074]
MGGVLLGVAGLALLDSANPSALAVTVYLLLTGGRVGRKVLAYVAGIVSVYLPAGVALLLGAGFVGDRLSAAVSSDVGYVLQGVIGVVLLVYGYWPRKPRQDDEPDRAEKRLSESQSLGAVFGLGALISVVEFSTAFPYLGAIGVLGSAQQPFVLNLLVLVGYNAVMVLPPLAICGAFLLFRDRVEPHLRRVRKKLVEETRKTFLWILTAVGALLVLSAVHHFRLHELI